MLGQEPITFYMTFLLLLYEKVQDDIFTQFCWGVQI